MAKTERRTIKVASVGTWRDIGQAKVLEFTGEDRVSYETWSGPLGEHIKAGAEIVADVEFTENTKDGKTYFHNKVIQVYVDGRPVKSKQGFSQDSPEKIASIESQKRADLICQLWIAGKIRDESLLAVKLQAWLGNLSPEIQSKITPEAPKAESPKIKAKEAPTDAAKPQDGEFANTGEFLTACSKNLGLNRTQVLQKLKTTSLDNINFTDAYNVLKETKAED